jgi:hypothetical protein
MTSPLDSSTPTSYKCSIDIFHPSSFVQKLFRHKFSVEKFLLRIILGEADFGNSLHIQFASCVDVVTTTNAVIPLKRFRKGSFGWENPFV